MIGKEYLLAALDAICQKLIQHEDELNHLDNVIGDGDHGTNMARFARKLLQEMPELAAKDDLGAIFHYVGMRCINIIGGSAGPLFGTFFLRAGLVNRGKTSLAVTDLLTAIEEGTMGGSQIGRSNEGEKTMLDALFPAGRAMEEALEKGANLAGVLQAGATAAQAGVDFTKTIQATKGRAAYLGSRSIGHQDPGATSVLLMLQAMQHTAETMKIE